LYFRSSCDQFLLLSALHILDPRRPLWQKGLLGPIAPFLRKLWTVLGEEASIGFLAELAKYSPQRTNSPLHIMVHPPTSLAFLPHKRLVVLFSLPVPAPIGMISPCLKFEFAPADGGATCGATLISLQSPWPV